MTGADVVGAVRGVVTVVDREGTALDGRTPHLEEEKMMSSIAISP